MSVYLLIDVSYLYNTVKTQICYEFPHIKANFEKRDHSYNLYSDSIVISRTVELFMSYIEHYTSVHNIPIKNVVMFRDGNHSKCWKREYNKVFKEGKSAFASPELETNPSEEQLNELFKDIQNDQHRKDATEDHIYLFERKNKRNLAFIHDFFDIITLLMFYLGDNYCILNQRLDAEADEQIFMFTEYILQKSCQNRVIILSGDTDFLQLITPCNKLDTLMYNTGISKLKTSYLKWEQNRNRISVIDPSIWENRVKYIRGELIVETQKVHGVELRNKYNETPEKLSLYLTYKIICGKPADGLAACATPEQIQYIYGKHVTHPMMTFPSTFKIKELLDTDKDFKDRFINNTLISYYKYTPQKIRDMIEPCLILFDEKLQRTSKTDPEGIFSDICHVQIKVPTRFEKLPKSSVIGFTIYHWLNQRNSEFIVNTLSKRVAKIIYRNLRDNASRCCIIQIKEDLLLILQTIQHELQRTSIDMIIDWINIKWYAMDSYMLHYICLDPTETVQETLQEYSIEFPNFKDIFYDTVQKCKEFIYSILHSNNSTN